MSNRRALFVLLPINWTVHAKTPGHKVPVTLEISIGSFQP